MVRNSTRKFKKLRGGFFPSIMGGLLTNGPIFFAPAFAQGVRLLRNNTARMKSRQRKSRQRKSRKNSKNV